MEAPNLLVLTDFFPASDRALSYATALAEPLGARLVVLHVRRTAVLDPEIAAGRSASLDPPAAQLALNRLTQHLPVPAVTEVSQGSVLDAVLDAVARHRPALIVLGRPDREELPDELASTTSLAILQKAPYPLLVVPPTYQHHTAPRRLLLAADGEPFTLGQFAGLARRLLNALQAELTVLHCASAPTSALAPAVDSVLQTGLVLDLPESQARQVVAARPAEGILEAATPAACDAVVLLARRRSVLGRLFHRSVTAEVLLHSQVPVLVLPVE